MKTHWALNAVVLLALWLLLMITALMFRTYIPVDETRYVTVAWDMWLDGDFLVPHLNGEPYAHKPPLLFWIYDVGWWLFGGVNEWWPRWVAPLFGLASLGLTVVLASQLWADVQVAQVVPWLLFGSLFWTGYGTTAMFDMLLVFFTLLGVWGIWRAARSAGGGWSMFVLATGLGILAKGPVVLVHLLPVALLRPWWRPGSKSDYKTWYLKLFIALLLGIGIALAWAIPAALHGGAAYAQAILWGQTAHRVVESFAHQRPFWWYLPLLPVLFFPWFWWPVLWKNRFIGVQALDAGLRFCLAWLVPSFLLLSSISGKQAHYLLPLFPAVALVMARGLQTIQNTHWQLRFPAFVLILLGGAMLLAEGHLNLPDWAHGVQLFWGGLLLVLGLGYWFFQPRVLLTAVRSLAFLSVFLVLVFHWMMREPLQRAYDLHPVAAEIARLQAVGAPIAHYGKYAGEYHFLGRLEQPITVLDDQSELNEWAQTHPDGFIVYYYSQDARTRLPRGGPFWQLFRDHYVAILDSRFYLKYLAH